ncbi:MAG: hypothetical protein JRI36_05905, partial [Deltaproteobacteria bacterium]|nr:hypothetical protein [Deltaproteobacteria bacterium]
MIVLLLGLVAWAAGLWSPLCSAMVYIDITAPHLRKIPTAVPFFKNLGPHDGDNAFVGTLSDLLAQTLAFTGFFEILDREAFLEDPQLAA